ncbi:MAG TPA: AraC family transcriptional regulator [Burkholderiales bacterium]|nr:AraC family transcriptional regulator [Burkholderiales bacterium]
MQRLTAWFSGAAFSRHRHDTYAIGITDAGVQKFWYRGATHASTPGDVVVLHPDEVHDGYAGTAAGFGYRILYVEPARIAEAVGGLPFVRDPVVRDRRFAATIDAAFDAPLEPLAVDALVFDLAEAMLHRTRAVPAIRSISEGVERARQLLDRATHRIVRSGELEAASGLTRFELARQFRARFGTTPYRYSLLRRLDSARARLGRFPVAQVALEAAFADQAHFTRSFRRAFGMTPARYAACNSLESAACGNSVPSTT